MEKLSVRTNMKRLISVALFLAVVVVAPFQACQREAIFDQTIQKKGGNGEGYEGMQGLTSSYSMKYNPNAATSGIFYRVLNSFACDATGVRTPSHAGRIILNSGTASFQSDVCSAEQSLVISNDQISYSPSFLLHDGIVYEKYAQEPNYTSVSDELRSFCRSTDSQNTGISVALYERLTAAVATQNKNLMKNSEQLELRPWIHGQAVAPNVEIAPSIGKTKPISSSWIRYQWMIPINNFLIFNLRFQSKM